MFASTGIGDFSSPRRAAAIRGGHNPVTIRLTPPILFARQLSGGASRIRGGLRCMLGRGPLCQWWPLDRLTYRWAPTQTKGYGTNLDFVLVVLSTSALAKSIARSLPIGRGSGSSRGLVTVATGSSASFIELQALFTSGGDSRMSISIKDIAYSARPLESAGF